MAPRICLVEQNYLSRQSSADTDMGQPRSCPQGVQEMKPMLPPHKHTKGRSGVTVIKAVKQVTLSGHWRRTGRQSAPLGLDSKGCAAFWNGGRLQGLQEREKGTNGVGKRSFCFWGESNPVGRLREGDVEKWGGRG